MRAVVQRVARAGVSVNGERIAEIGRGMVILLGVGAGDSSSDAGSLAEKCLNLRIFEDAEGKMNLSALEVGADLLAISQFTLYGNCRKGRRPSFTEAAPAQVAEDLYEEFVSSLRKSGLRVETGRFGARMLVEIHNEGPVTFILDT
ncbi:D-tyrosyl-tRNA(Tyr) deacylase [candidate division TA06 bacterium DG_24]|jgi:D-tyrosyl-tRNA(Tyr) deacylase|uniref:D-aminoacyl-tRNA deacylase n=3 Tax=Bacteria division TA06 TaxID=1156500 RepID=A0A0S8JN58_UNCT6|nr:MAG: D-tyrosyl-tRNA(Tyr) deacylase [candidate division TA06 bacterium DG_24]KPK71614.1 MAG: D-tyrosyl-tRNA(Tyr) deacylase [candidate division TA06 bacterium SM23_40]KPL10221.1 MAG: D-tyrosyl-tRNA(Tyr) deacylase [candidate division TA06 bacterium SM1_40]